jgi:hypothetical protein
MRAAASDLLRLHPLTHVDVLACWDGHGGDLAAEGFGVEDIARTEFAHVLLDDSEEARLLRGFDRRPDRNVSHGDQHLELLVLGPRHARLHPAISSERDARSRDHESRSYGQQDAAPHQICRRTTDER